MKNNMNCKEFQEVLPYIIESGGSTEEEEHLRTCPACAGLVEDFAADHERIDRGAKPVVLDDRVIHQSVRRIAGSVLAD